jgi:hypothetical protein
VVRNLGEERRHDEDADGPWQSTPAQGWHVGVRNGNGVPGQPLVPGQYSQTWCEHWWFGCMTLTCSTSKECMTELYKERTAST